MGWASRANPRKADTVQERKLRQVLGMFPDRATYEQWLTARSVPEELRAYMEPFLPKALQAQERV